MFESLRDLGIHELFINLLHDPSSITIAMDKTFDIFGGSRKPPFAMLIGDFSGKVWACSDGYVVREAHANEQNGTILVTKSAIPISMKPVESLV